MLKHHQLLCVLLAGGVAVPTVTGQGDDLMAGLDATVTKLEELIGIRADIEARRPGAVDRLVEATDAPLPATRERDDAYAHLRDDVARLQSQLDELDRVAIDRIVDDPRDPGLTDAQRNGAVLGGPNPIATPVKEADDYSADPVREARLLIRAKRHAEAEALLAKQTATSETRYWRARALVGLGRDNDAIAELELVAADDAAGDLQRWAQQDKKMIEVRLELSRGDQRNGGGSK
jgi:hypothetical protein